MKTKTIDTRFLRASLVALAMGLLTIAVPAHAANAPATLNISSGQLVQYSYYELGSNTQINIEKGGTLDICTGYENFATLNANIHFLSTGSGTALITSEPCQGGSPTPPTAKGIIINGNITLDADASVTAYGATVAINGGLTSNGHNLAVSSFSGGRVLGSGRVGTVTLDDGSVIAPGNSPGIINTGNLALVSGSGYDFELGGTTVGTDYDQINVTGTVDLGGGTLNVLLYNDFKPTVGQKFTIISNDASDAITGTFAGLSEGDSFVSDGYTYTISYTGGTGNDVVLTVVPASPDTGFVLATSNPVLVVAVTAVAAVTLMLIARRLSAARRLGR